MNFSFESFVNGEFDYDKTTDTHHCLWLRQDNKSDDGNITFKDIDRLKDYPYAEVVTISNLNQETFEYFIKTYGKQCKAIRFFKNKFIEDLSLLATLPQLEYLSFFANKKVATLWNMSENKFLTALCIEDFTKLTSIKGVETAPALKELIIGNAVYSRMVIDSFMPLESTKIEKLSFTGQKILDNDLSFLERMPNLKEFHFATNLFSTEQVAWIVANYPMLEGYALKAKIDFYFSDSKDDLRSIIVGKRKPTLKGKENEEKIQNYVSNFDILKKQYQGVPYKVAFKIDK